MDTVTHAARTPHWHRWLRTRVIVTQPQTGATYAGYFTRDFPDLEVAVIQRDGESDAVHIVPYDWLGKGAA